MRKMTVLMVGTAIAVALGACSSDPGRVSNGSPSASGPDSSLNLGTPSTIGRAAESSNEGTPITITAGGRRFTALLNNSAAARDLVQSMPMTIPAARIGGIEYMVELPAPLTETGPFYRSVEAGDIVYWNPRNSVTVIYAPTSPVSELTKLGEVTSDLNAFRDLPSNVEMRFEVA